MSKQNNEMRTFINIGSDRVSVVIGCPQENDAQKAVLMGVGNSPIKGNEDDYNQIRLAIKNAVSKAESTFKTRINSAWVCISDPKLLTLNKFGKVSLQGEDVNNQHMVAVLTNAKQKAKDKLVGRYVSHLISQCHWQGETPVASLKELMEVKNHYGEISASFHFMTQPSESYNDTLNLFRGLGFDVEGVIFDMLAGAKYALKDDEKQEGVLFINLGEKCTSYAFYLEGVLATSASLPDGTKELLNTLRERLSVSKQEARAILSKYASLMLTNPAQLLKINAYEGSTNVNAKFLYEMVKPHYDTVFDAVFEHLSEQGIEPECMPRGVVVCGEGACVKNLRAYFAGRYYPPIRHATINDNIKLHEKFIIGDDEHYEALTQHLKERSNRLALGAMLYYFQSIQHQRYVYGAEYSNVEYSETKAQDINWWHWIKTKIPLWHA